MTTWKVSTYYKKSCEEHEIYVKDGLTIKRKTGWRGATFYVETTDNNSPEFEFGFVPGGDGKKDSINMCDCVNNNIESVELDNMWDGCWEDWEWPTDMDDDEIESLQERIEEDGSYEVLEDQEGWTLDEREVWCWGPILIEDADGNQVKIIVADDDGNVVEFKNE